MTNKVLPNKPGRSPRDDQPSTDISKEIISTIHGLEAGLSAYPIRKMVEHAEQFGPFLKKQRLETNQIRKFLDAINRLKANLAQGDSGEESAKNDAKVFSAIEPEIVLLKPKLAYAAARQKAAKPLSDVMSAAIDKVHSLQDFERLVQLIESIIAYHKAEGGR
jgi:CRISPR-associated protein Csm2